MERRKLAFLLHGFASTGEGSIHLLRPYLEAAGYTVKALDYGWTGLVGVRLCDSKIARAVSQIIPVGADVWAHSNGCTIAQEMSLYGAPFSQMVFLSPALDSNAKIGKQVERVHVWTAAHDKPLWFAKFLPLHPWGDMGLRGYTGDDPRFTTYRTTVQEHTRWFDKQNLNYYVPQMILKVKEHNDEKARCLA